MPPFRTHPPQGQSAMPRKYSSPHRGRPDKKPVHPWVLLLGLCILLAVYYKAEHLLLFAGNVVRWLAPIIICLVVCRYLWMIIRDCLYVAHQENVMNAEQRDREGQRMVHMHALEMHQRNVQEQRIINMHAAEMHQRALPTFTDPPSNSRTIQVSHIESGGAATRPPTWSVSWSMR